jgi:hypothetical protein
MLTSAMRSQPTNPHSTVAMRREARCRHAIQACPHLALAGEQCGRRNLLGILAGHVPWPAELTIGSNDAAASGEGTLSMS